VSISELAPQNLDAEESVLGAMMLSPKAVSVVDQILEPEHFYRPSHGLIFRTAVDLRARGEPVDAITLTEELERNGKLEDAGGRGRIHELACLVPATANVGHYAKIVRNAARRRQEGTVARALEQASMNGGLVAHSEIREQLSALLEDRAGSSGITPLDLSEVLSGPIPETPWRWQGWLAEGDLAILAGDPGVGKSIIGLLLADAIRRGADFLGEPCERGRVGILDLENPASEAIKRLRRAGLTTEDHDGLFYFHAPSIDIGSRAGLDVLAEMVDRYELDVLIIDSLRRAAPGLDENDSAAVSSVLSPLRALSADSGRTIVLAHHSRKRQTDGATEAGQMVRGSLDLVASVDVLLYVRAKEAGAFTLEQAKSRRGLPHESILVRIEGDGDDAELRLTNEGAVARADDKVEATLAQIVQKLAETGGPLERQVLALRVDKDPKDGTFSRALKLGFQREMLAKSPRERPTDPQLYALAEGVTA
jgi:hypothetical protein